MFEAKLWDDSTEEVNALSQMKTLAPMTLLYYLFFPVDMNSMNFNK